MALEATVTVAGGGALSLTYTTSCCRALFHLDPVAKFVWKSSLLVLLDSQGALCGLLLYFECCVSLLGTSSTMEICFSPWHVRKEA